MASFAEVESVEPDLADRVRAIRTSTINAVLATIRQDGSPRLSGVDPFFHDGQLDLVDAGSPQGQDLRRDPRLSLHSIPWDSRRLRDGAADVGAADAKVNGTATVTTDPAERSAFPLLVDVRTWLRAARGLGPVHDRHRCAHRHLGRQRTTRDRPVVEHRRPPDDPSLLNRDGRSASTAGVDPLVGDMHSVPRRTHSDLAELLTHAVPKCGVPAPTNRSDVQIELIDQATSIA